MIRRFALAVLAFTLTAGAAHAGSYSDPLAAGFQPRVPISALGIPAGWFDASRLHMSSSLSVGSGWGGGSSALQVTSFSYQFKAPVAMNVSVGNAFGAGASSRSSFFLEGLDLTYRPSANAVFRVQFRDVRSPLQYGYPGAGDRAFWGY
jgi:hypothetical protein